MTPPRFSPFFRFGLAIMLLGLALLPIPAAAQGQVTGGQVDYTFGGQATFEAQVQGGARVKEASLVFRPQGEANTVVEAATVKPGGKLTYQLSLDGHPFRAFSTVEYWFQVTLTDGQQITSPTYTFFYEDNRYSWNTRVRGPVHLHWYEGDEAFAQRVLDTAEEGLQHIRSLYPIPDPIDPINIYVYASSQEMQSTLRLAGQAWMAGHADPDLRVVVVALPEGPEQQLITEERIPHELMHILLYQSVGAGYNALPAWLNEGVASVAELVPNPDYQILLERANEKEGMIPFASLCQSFPMDSSGAALAYAQASSFTRYLVQQYGASGLQSLVKNYADGQSCERGFETAYGVTLEQAQTQWLRASFGSSQPTPAAPGELLPWAALIFSGLAAPLGLTVIGLLRHKPQPEV